MYSGLTGASLLERNQNVLQIKSCIHLTSSLERTVSRNPAKLLTIKLRNSCGIRKSSNFLSVCNVCNLNKFMNAHDGSKCSITEVTYSHSLIPNSFTACKVKGRTLGELGQDPRKRIQDRLIRSGNVEQNPGPKTANGWQDSALQVTSYNVRGLNDECKLRHLINHLYQRMRNKNSDLIVCLQETYLTKPGKIPFLWRGNFELTSGNGNSCGCITLLSPHLNIIRASAIDDRAHVLAIQRTGETEVTYIVANVYAPNPNSNEKVTFFERIFDTINEFRERFNCDAVLMLGDFNLNFSENEIKNRAYPAQEKRVAMIVKDLADQNDLSDCWNQLPKFTWRRPNTETFSTIDRILFSKSKFKTVHCKPNWALSFSDHAAVEAAFEKIHEERKVRSRIVRLDPSLAKDPVTAHSIIEEFRRMMSDMPSTWDSFKKLEFAKVCIRTVVERVQAERKKLEQSEEELLNEELECAIEQLSKNIPHGSIALIDHIEVLRNRKALLIDRKGKRLADKLGTKWYNEGEKSNRYFMRLLNRANPDHFKKIETGPGSIVTNEKDIENEIVDFYKNLYETFDDSLILNNDPGFFNEILPISAQDNAELARPLTIEELRSTLHTCEDSTPGPDGIPYSIIGLLWNDFGPILLEAWNYSLENRTLAPSHKKSYLKLIPKAGKNPDKLTNWRPITLSNCDHKLITKTYSIRMCNKISGSIGGGQTAYLKGRLINDNLRSLLATINVTNIERDLNGIIVALDAKKAFDSVSHEYIESCLKSFGCHSFIAVFRTLYSDLSTDILINGKIVKGFNIKRGVKQGDALSCILFIMCIEPLLRNINANNEISHLTSTTLNAALPKTYSYADDVSGTIKNDENSLRAFFKEYERLTRLSGLELNAEKTEILQLGNDILERQYSVSYLGKTHLLNSVPEIKINGLYLCREMNALRTRNVDAVIGKMDRHFQNWSRRSLSLLGKVLIAKTFGLSQAIYLMQSLTLLDTDFKKMNATIYKFIWNRHYQAAKAPERIKRDIMCKGINLGGFGMLDLAQLDCGLKIKAFGRILNSCHPFLQLLNDKIDITQFFSPKCAVAVEGVLTKGLVELTHDRNELWSKQELDGNRALTVAIRNTRISDLISEPGRNSVIFYIISRTSRVVGDLQQAQLRQLERYIAPDKIKKMRLAVATNPGRGMGDSLETSYYINGRFRHLKDCSSKEIRSARADSSPILDFKVGLTLTATESLSWCNKISKLTSIRHRNTLLRIAHGEVYTKVRLTRFGLTNDPTCPRCDLPESLAHKISECEYIKRIWISVSQILKEHSNGAVTSVKTIMGTELDTSIANLTVKAEILQRILSLKDLQTYLIHPKTFVIRAVEYLIKKETKRETCEELKSLLES